MSTAAWIATVVVIIILILFFFYGLRRGYLKIVLTTLALIVTIVAAGLLAPHLSKWLGTTFIGTGIEKSIDSYMDKKIDKQSEALVNKTKEMQETVIEKLPLPKFLKKDISKKNETSQYKLLDVSTFKEYISKRLSNIILQAISYIILLIVIYAVLRIILKIVGVIGKIPIIGGINRLLGGILCLVEGLLILWCLCFLITAISGTAFGESVLKVINESPVLKLIYDNNLLGMLVSSVFKAS